MTSACLSIELAMGSSRGVSFDEDRPCAAMVQTAPPISTPPDPALQ